MNPVHGKGRASGMDALGPWEDKTFAFLAGQGWNPADSHLLLAVSGGADSVALLHFWARSAGPRLGCRLTAAHVDHGLRDSSPADGVFVADLCRDLGVPLLARVLDPASRPARQSVEMWARGERYRFFSEAAREAGADWILTGHHRDDMVETVFQRLGRGTGPRGLKGIPFLRHPGIVRPFLDRSRGEILAYLEMIGAAWREDATNADAGIDRNWYRHRFLPALRLREPDLDARIFAAAMSMQAMEAGIDAWEEDAGLLRTDESGEPFLGLDGIRDRVSQGDLDSLGYWMKRLVSAASPRRSSASPEGRPGAEAPPVTKEILMEFCRQWKSGSRNLRVPLAGGMAFNRENSGIFLVSAPTSEERSGEPAKKSCSTEYQRIILKECFCEVSWRSGDKRFTLSARRYPKPERFEYPEPRGETAIFDADLFSCTLLVRSRKAGDRFSPLGIRSRTRKLKTFFNEEKVPLGMRDTIPIILTGESPGRESPAWVPGHGISDFFKVSGSTSHILELVLTCRNP